ncbi:MAG TPA: DUF4167 domain-containing protein [Afifellaceae bacterium]|nr:DUF4167 domain-containing protein [Afifellaceae bacterium]
MRHTQNRRSRGRSRKGPNPLTRSYESNGPDVKVRGTAAHVAEKYMTLARDALASGDTISAENYHQHAEHYNRIVAAAQQAQYQQTQQTQQRDGPDETRDGEQTAKSAGGDQGGDGPRDRQDGQPESRDDSSADEGGKAVSMRQGPEVGAGGDDKAERPRRQRRPRAEAGADTGKDGSSGTASGEQAALAPADGDGDAATADAPKPNGRRRKPAAEKSAANEAGETASAEDDANATKDGAAALAAFPD